jgi:hypothetical protein
MSSSGRLDRALPSPLIGSRPNEIRVCDTNPRPNNDTTPPRPIDPIDRVEALSTFFRRHRRPSRYPPEKLSPIIRHRSRGTCFPTGKFAVPLAALVCSPSITLTKGLSVVHFTRRFSKSQATTSRNVKITTRCFIPIFCPSLPPTLSPIRSLIIIPRDGHISKAIAIPLWDITRASTRPGTSSANKVRSAVS